MTLWDVAWVVWGLIFVGIEFSAIYINWKDKSKSKTRRTLSSFIWFLGGTTEGYRADFWGWIRRAILGAFLVWLTVHFLSGGQIV